jgi:SOS response regulatory protein OraA/RecX
MINLEQILADKNTFPDTIETTIGDQKVTLGDLRGLSARQQKELSDKMAGATQRETQASETALRAANLLSELEKVKEDLKSQKAAPPTEDEFDKEDFWKPARERITKVVSERDAKIDKALKAIEQLSGTVERAATIWAQERWNVQFDKVAPRLKKVDAYKDWDSKKVIEYATQHKIVDDYGFPSVERAVAELTRATDIDTIKKEAYEEGLKKGRLSTRMENMPKPSSASGGAARKPGTSAVEEIGLEGLGDDVMADPELMEQLAALSDLKM